MLVHFFTMIGTYEQRKVKNDDLGDFVLDTALVTDREWTYETAVKHKDFNNGDWIILEGTDTEEAALEAHKKWLEKLKSGVDSLKDCYEEITYERGA